MQEGALGGAEQPADQAQFEADKRAVYKHPLFPLLALLLERCEQATQGATPASSPAVTPVSGATAQAGDSFSRDLQAFVQIQQRERRPLLTDEPELDGLMIKALQVLRIHLLELEKVQELCRDFCSRYIACLRGKMQSENLLRADYNGGGGNLENNNNVGSGGGSSSSNSPTQLTSSPTQVLNASGQSYAEDNQYGFLGAHSEDANHFQRNEPEYNSTIVNTVPPYIESAAAAVFDGGAHTVLGSTPLGQIGAGMGPPVPDSYQGQLSPSPSTDDQESGGESVCGISGRRQKRGVLPKQATSVMRAWLFQHLVHPYPTEDEKRSIAAQTNLTLLQVNNWFINARRRILQPMLEATDGQPARPVCDSGASLLSTSTTQVAPFSVLAVASGTNVSAAHVMRFNKTELEALAVQPSHRFDREGVLYLREKQDGFFRRAEVLQGRWCRLRGNLLFYLRSAEPWSESAGLFVLEHCTISPEPPDPNGLWPFVIVFHGGASQRLAATSESERATWLLSLQTASYDCMRAQLQALQQRLEECRGPMPALDLDMWRLQRGHTIDLAEAPLCEASLACDNLLCDGHGRPPSACVEVHVRAFSSPTPAWVKYARTEVVERSSNPCFLATVSFRATDGLGPTSAMRFTVYDVCERISNTATPLGSATIVLGAIQDSARVRVALRGPGGGASGFLTVSGCTPEPEPRPPGSPARSAPTANGHANGVIESVGSPAFMTHRRSQSLPPRLGVKLRVPSQGPLQALFTAPHIQTYRLHSGLGGDICVMEIMAESRVCYTIPQQLLSIWMQREKELLQEISAMGELGGAWRGPQMQLLDRHLHLLRQYSQAKQSLQAQSSKGSHFKASSRKGDTALEFAAVNLHLQRMWAHNDTLNRSGVSDIITVGAFTAHCGPTKSGGLIRLVQQSKLCPDKDLDHTCKVDAANDAIQAIKQLRRELVDCMTQLMALARARKSVGMMPLCEDMVRRSKSLLTIWDAGLVEEAFRFLEAHRATPDDSGFSEDHSLDMSPFKRIAQQLGSLELKSPDLEDFATPCSPNQPMDWPQPFPVANDASFSSLSFSETHFDVNGTVSNGGQPLSLNVSLNNSNNSSFVDSVLESPGANYYRPSEEPEPWDLTQLNIEASVMCLVSKVKFLCGRCGSPAVRLRQPREALRGSLKAPLISTALTNGSDNPKEITTTPTLKHIAVRGNKFTDGLDLSTTGDWAGELRPSMRKLRQATDGLLKTARLTHSVFRLQQNAREARRAATLQLRRDVCFSQALTALISGLCARLWGGPVDPQFLCLISSPTGNPVGPLACFEGLLSLHGGEADMWGDMCVAVEDLAIVTFTLQRSQLPLNKSALPQVIGTRGALTVLLPAPDHVMTCKHISSFRVTPVFFNIGINEMATLAEALGQSAPQRRSNLDSLGRLMTYHQQYQRAMGPSPALHNLVENLRQSIHSSTGKNVEVLHLASDVTRRMQGMRFTSCKSAKDRTGMSVTLEQCRILVQDYHLSAQELPKALDAMRSEGCRRENTMKNTGVRRYAFNSLQVVALPPKYRPPAGTYGSAQT